MKLLRTRSRAVLWRVWSRMKRSITSTAEGRCCRMTGVAASASSSVGELDGEDGLGFRQRDEVELGFEHDAERAFGADHQLGEIEGLVRTA